MGRGIRVREKYLGSSHPDPPICKPEKRISSLLTFASIRCHSASLAGVALQLLARHTNDISPIRCDYPVAAMTIMKISISALGIPSTIPAMAAALGL